MANRFILKRNSVTGTVPTSGALPTQLITGELAVNLADRRLFVNNGTAIVPIGPVVNTVTANYTLLASDNNSIVSMNNGAVAVTITVPTGLVAGYQCTIIQLGTGNVVIAPAAGMTRVSRVVGRTRVVAQFGIAGVTLYNTTNFILSGDTA